MSDIIKLILGAFCGLMILAVIGIVYSFYEYIRDYGYMKWFYNKEDLLVIVQIQDGNGEKWFEIHEKLTHFSSSNTYTCSKSDDIDIVKQKLSNEKLIRKKNRLSYKRTKTII